MSQIRIEKLYAKDNAGFCIRAVQVHLFAGFQQSISLQFCQHTSTLLIQIPSWRNFQS